MFSTSLVFPSLAPPAVSGPSVNSGTFPFVPCPGTFGQLPCWCPPPPATFLSRYSARLRLHPFSYVIRCPLARLRTNLIDSNLYLYPPLYHAICHKRVWPSLCAIAISFSRLASNYGCVALRKIKFAQLGHSSWSPLVLTNRFSGILQLVGQAANAISNCTTIVVVVYVPGLSGECFFEA